MNNPLRFITFDVLGTLVDWKSGLEQACETEGRPLNRGEFDRIIDAQAGFEQAKFLSYTKITELSLQQALGLTASLATKISAGIGSWPFYADSIESLKQLLAIFPCGAMTNSDRLHGDQIQARLGFKLSAWLCAEETGVYKPHPRFWQLMSERQHVPLGPDWWHVSAYADYDLAAANQLGLTTVFVARPHNRPSLATHSVNTLHEFLSLVLQ